MKKVKFPMKEFIVAAMLRHMGGRFLPNLASNAGIGVNNT